MARLYRLRRKFVGAFLNGRQCEGRGIIPGECFGAMTVHEAIRRSAMGEIIPGPRPGAAISCTVRGPSLVCNRSFGMGEGERVLGVKDFQDGRGRFRKGAHWRPRKPFWDRAWLTQEYGIKKRSAGEIAREFGITENAILFWLAKHDIPRRSSSDAAKLRPHDVAGAKNPMWGRTGSKNPNWGGGRTPMRQSLYATAEWRAFARRIKKRDPICRLCGGGVERLEIHHIEPFRFAPLLFMDEQNVVRLCQTCHRGLKNRERYYRRRLFKLVGAL